MKLGSRFKIIAYEVIGITLSAVIFVFAGFDQGAVASVFEGTPVLILLVVITSSLLVSVAGATLVEPFTKVLFSEPSLLERFILVLMLQIVAYSITYGSVVTTVLCLNATMLDSLFEQYPITNAVAIFIVLTVTAISKRGHLGKREIAVMVLSGVVMSGLNLLSLALFLLVSMAYIGISRFKLRSLRFVRHVSRAGQMVAFFGLSLTIGHSLVEANVYLSALLIIASFVFMLLVFWILRETSQQILPSDSDLGKRTSRASGAKNEKRIQYAEVEPVAKPTDRSIQP